MAEGKAADGGRVQVEGEAARDIAGGEAVAGRRSRAEELAQEWLDRGRPERGVIAARSARLPAALGACGAGAEVVGVDLVKAGAPDFESRSGRRGWEPARAEGGEDFADQRCAETMGELLIEFFTARTIPERAGGRQARSALGRCVRRPNAECSRLLATRQRSLALVRGLHAGCVQVANCAMSVAQRRRSGCVASAPALPRRSRRVANAASSGFHSPTMIRAAGNWLRSRMQSERAAMVETGGNDEMHTVRGASATACAISSEERSFD